MASSKEYLQFILEQLSDLEEINYRAMMGEYIIYYRGRIVGGIYDDRLLVKPTKSAVSYMASVSIIPLKQSLPLMTLGTAAGLACSQHMRIDLKKITFGLMDQKFI